MLGAEEEDYPEDAGTPGGVLPDDVDRKAAYVLAIPVGRDADLPPERWAVQKVKYLADGAHLDLRPVGAGMARRRRLQEPHWFVCEPRSAHANRRLRWLFNAERRVGLHDTEAVLFGSFGNAPDYQPLGWLSVTESPRTAPAACENSTD